MTRRLRLIAAPAVAVLATLAATSCATFDPPAATVDGTEIDNDTLAEGVDALESLTPEQNQALGPFDVVDGTGTSGRTARVWLGYLIREQIGALTLERLGGTVTEADLAIADTTIEGDAFLPDTPPVLQDAIRTTIAQNQAIQRVAVVPSPAELEATYNDSPARTGAMCLQHILVESRAEAEDLRAQIEAGADFATLAAEHSTDVVTAQSGGVLLSQDGLPCISLQEMIGSFDARFTSGALAARPGVPTAPIEGAFGWHVIRARPFAEIGDALTATVAAAPGLAAAYAGYVTTPVDVASRFGRWDPAVANVVAHT